MADDLEGPIFHKDVAPRNDMNNDGSSVVFHRLNIPQNTDCKIPSLSIVGILAFL
jgi:hypothetical protein